MTQTLFYDWLNRLDRYVSLKANQKVLLLLDNCTAHGNNGTAPELNHIDVLYLPPSTISRLQPLDAGIVLTVKKAFRRRLLFRVFENIEAVISSVYNADIMKAICWITVEWR